ncbi:MAG: hypothetical protein D6731_11630 [Planctomycetota bacterium]|nr:MAG: hypothetical protein D6731_11630 [Planctomycetota bacterium]
MGARAELREKGVRRVGFTARGALIVAGARGLKVCTPELRPQRTLRGPSSELGRGLATSPLDESVLCSDGATIYLADADKGRVEGERRLRSRVLALARSPRDDFALAACEDGLLRVDLREDQVTWLERDRTYRAIRFSNDGRVAAAGGRGFVELWRLNAQPTRGARLVGHEGYVTAVALGPKGRLLASGGEDGSLRLWDLRAREEQRCIPAHTGTVNDLDLNPHVQRAVTVGEDGALRLWDIPTGELVFSAEAHPGGANGVAWFGDGIFAVSGGADAVRTWRLPGVDEPPAEELPEYSPRAVFRVGDRLSHPVFGVGTVTSVAGKMILVAFAGESRRLAHGR